MAVFVENTVKTVSEGLHVVSRKDIVKKNERGNVHVWVIEKMVETI